MNTKRRWRWWCTAGCGLALAALSGCQTWVAGMTLPSGHYLQHPPQYFAPGPAFPLTRELTRMEEQQANVAVPAPGVAPPPAPLPAPVPGAPPAGP
jgi:hypothetical protein